MKKISLILFNWIAIAVYFILLGCSPRNDSVAAPSASSNQNNPKSIYVSSEKEFSKALETALPGETIVLRSGTYSGHFECGTSGTKESPITICAHTGETVVLTIPKDSDGASIATNGCRNLIFSNLSFSDLLAYDTCGILMTGGETDIAILNCTFNNIATSDPGTMDNPGGGASAILLLGESDVPISNITIENNNVFDNVNGWSENISIAGNCEFVSVKNNTVHDCTNIGIDFYGNAEYCSNLELDQPRNCECIGNTVYNCKCFYSDNAGIYVDGAYNILVEANETYNNPYGIEIGSEEWRDYYAEEKCVSGITVKANSIHDNYVCGLRLGGWSDDETTGVVRNCSITSNIFQDNVDEIILSKCDSILFENNVFSGGKTCQQAIVYDDGISRNKITNIKII